MIIGFRGIAKKLENGGQSQMPPPQLFAPEWFLRNIVNRRIIDKLLDRITRFYDDLFMEIVYRAHHGSFKITYSDIFYNDFMDYVVRACGLKKRLFWKYLPEESILRHMYERRKRFLQYLKKPPEKRKHKFFGDINVGARRQMTPVVFNGSKGNDHDISGDVPALQVSQAKVPEALHVFGQWLFAIRHFIKNGKSGFFGASVRFSGGGFFATAEAEARAGCAGRRGLPGRATGGPTGMETIPALDLSGIREEPIVHVPEGVLLGGALARETGHDRSLAQNREFLVNEVDFTGVDVRFIQKRSHLTEEAATIRSGVVRPFVDDHRRVRIAHGAGGARGRVEISHQGREDDSGGSCGLRFRRFLGFCCGRIWRGVALCGHYRQCGFDGG